jgi:ADP-heptose:LPS heptosyltransferase
VFAPKFYPLQAEIALAEATKRAMQGPVIFWSIHGSSCHKVYPWTQVVVRWLADKKVHVILSGDKQQGVELQIGMMQALENGGCDMAFVHPMAGKMDIREALTLASVADVVVGPETGVLNSVCMDDVKKVIMLSHSSHENLTKHWLNTLVLEPDNMRCPCFPCNRLHYGWEHCVQNAETKAAQCASSVAPEAVFGAIMTQLGFLKGGYSGLDLVSRKQDGTGRNRKVA